MEKTMKKFGNCLFISLVVFMFLCSGFSIDASHGKSHMDMEQHWAAKAVENLEDVGILKGYEDGSFRPDEPLRRAELAVILNRILKYQTTISDDLFTDVDATMWYADAVNRLGKAGVLKGSDGLARPLDTITREEAIVMIARAMHIENDADSVGTFVFSDDDEISEWAKSHIYAMQRRGYIQGFDAQILPKANISRAELATIIDNIIEKFYLTSGTYSEHVNGNAVANSPDFVLKNMTIEKDLYIAHGADNGKISIENVKIVGVIYILCDNCAITIGEGTQAAKIMLVGQNNTVHNAGEIKIVEAGSGAITENVKDKMLDLNGLKVVYAALMNYMPEAGDTMLTQVGLSDNTVATKGIYYQWQRKKPSGSTWQNISNATEKEYVPMLRDVGYEIRFAASYKSNGVVETVYSNEEKVYLSELEAKIGTTKFCNKIEDAILSANDGDVVNVVRDVVLSRALVVTKDVTLETNVGATISIGFEDLRHIQIKGGAQLIIKNLVLDGSDVSNGGGIDVGRNGSLVLENVIIENCKAQNGGGIYAIVGSNITISGGKLTGNQAAGYGGGIYTAGGAVNISECSFKNNKAGVGGADLYNDGSVVIGY